MSVCFLRRCFPLTQHKSPENFLDTSPHQCTVTILTWFLSSAIPHIWLMFIFLMWRRCWGQWPKLFTLLCWKIIRQLWVFPVWLLWTPNLHLSLSVEILVMEQVVPASVFLPGGTRAPEVQTVSIIVRWSHWSRNPGQTKAGYHQLWHSHYCQRRLGPDILLVSSQIWELYALV